MSNRDHEILATIDPDYIEGDDDIEGSHFMDEDEDWRFDDDDGQPTMYEEYQDLWGGDDSFHDLGRDDF